ncbi:MAG: LCP family protein [Actinomycetota bacterium]|nr:LCP family protein [Actinomycetota bacterium]
MRGVAILVLVILLVAGGGLAYISYRLGQIRTVHCHTCAAPVAGGAPFNVLLIGDDSRADNTPGESIHFGTTAQAGGAHSDTIKILHVDPASERASLLSIPRDTYVELSGLSQNWVNLLGTTKQKINAALNDSPDSLIQTIANTFGIPIQYYVMINFNGLMSAVNTVGGINLNFPYPARDNDNGNNNSGLNITHAGCQTLNGGETLALARSRYYEYEIAPGVWQFDGTGDLGRIKRQNAVIEALMSKAKSTYNPLSLNSFIGALVNDVVIGGGLSATELVSLALRYHAFSGTSLPTATIPTAGATSAAGDVEVVQQPATNQLVRQFLGGPAGPITTPPLDAYGDPVATSTTPSTGSAQPSTTPASVASQSDTHLTAHAPPAFDPTPC